MPQLISNHIIEKLNPIMNAAIDVSDGLIKDLEGFVQPLVWGLRFCLAIFITIVILMI